MKKMILLFYIALLCVSCDPEQNAWDWVVENNTEQTLTLKFPYLETYQNYTLQPGKSFSLHTTQTNTSQRNSLHFDYYFEMAVSRHNEDAYWQLLSEDGTVLKTWNYSDKDLPNQRFFDPSSWIKKQEPGGGEFVITTYSWTFEIQPEDISSN